MKYTETRTLNAVNLRKLCIERDWYTCGDNEEYQNLFNRLRDENGNPVEMTTEKLAEIATDIKEHSDTDYEISMIMFDLARVCFTYFEEE